MRIFDKFFKRKNSYPAFNLDFCVEKGLLTKEEKLRIEKERAIEKWEEEILRLKKKDKK